MQVTASEDVTCCLLHCHAIRQHRAHPVSHAEACAVGCSLLRHEGVLQAPAENLQVGALQLCA